MRRIRFRATIGELTQMMANAVNRSKPVGLGIFHFQDKWYTAKEMESSLFMSDVNLDYYDGRMVKLYIRHNPDGTYEMRDEFRPDYQSFCGEYPTGRALLHSVGITDFQILEA